MNYFKHAAGQMTTDEVLVEAREDVKRAMANGKSLVLNLGTTAPNFKTDFNNDEVLSTSTLFDRAAWMEESNLRNHALHGASKGFTLIIRSSVETEEQLAEVMRKIPNIA